MRLLFLNHNVAWSGTFFRAFQLARALAPRGHDVTVVTTSPTERLARRDRERDGVRLIEMPDLFWGRGRTGWDPSNILRRSFGLRAADFDAVHAFDCRPAVILPALHLSFYGGLPLAIDWCDWWGRGGTIAERPGRLVNRLIGGVETWFEESFRTRAAATTVISRALQDRAIALGVPADSILRFPNGCEHELIRPQPRGTARADLGLAPDAEILVHVGLVYPRDLELLLGAMEHVLRVRPRARLVLVGNPKTPVPRDRLPSEALTLTGFLDVEVLERWLAAADACVIPLSDTVSNRGRWPAKLSDYLCAGRPIVTTRVGDAADWVDRHDAGWTSAPEPADLGRALLAALAGAGGEGLIRGGRGRALAAGPLSWQTVATEVEAFYGRCLMVPKASRSLDVS